MNAAGHLADIIIAKTKIESSTSSFMSTLPAYSNPNFSGREKELGEIWNIFEISVGLHQRAAIFGMGGIG